MHATTTTPVSLTSEAVLERKAEEWIAANGQPDLQLVDAAIVRSAAAGDPFLDNQFRHALVRVALRLRASALDEVAR